MISSGRGGGRRRKGLPHPKFKFPLNETRSTLDRATLCYIWVHLAHCRWSQQHSTILHSHFNSNIIWWHKSKTACLVPLCNTFIMQMLSINLQWVPISFIFLSSPDVWDQYGSCTFFLLSFLSISLPMAEFLLEQLLILTVINGLEKFIWEWCFPLFALKCWTVIAVSWDTWMTLTA